MTILTVTGLTRPAAGHFSAATLSPAILTKGGTGAALAWIFPAVFTVAAAAGIAWALIMKATRPQAYAAIGSGPEEK